MEERFGLTTNQVNHAMETRLKQAQQQGQQTTAPQGLYQAPPTPTATLNKASEPTVGDALDHQLERLQVLHQVISLLEGRLHSVLRPSDPECGANGAAPSPSSVYGRISMHNEAIFIAESRLQALLRRLEL